MEQPWPIGTSLWKFGRKGMKFHVCAYIDDDDAVFLREWSRRWQGWRYTGEPLCVVAEFYKTEPTAQDGEG